jgi:hypothetical protein
MTRGLACAGCRESDWPTPSPVLQRSRSGSVKALDVQLAVDMVVMGTRDENDAAYLLSADGDYTGAVDYMRSPASRGDGKCRDHSFINLTAITYGQVMPSLVRDATEKAAADIKDLSFRQSASRNGALEISAGNNHSLRKEFVQELGDTR